VRGLTAVAVFALSGCAGLSYSPELTVIFGPSRFEGTNEPHATFMLLQRFGQRGVAGCVHSSEPRHGYPFNDDEEMTMDTCGVGGRWGGKPQ
jgi:hypothetical protein